MSGLASVPGWAVGCKATAVRAVGTALATLGEAVGVEGSTPRGRVQAVTKSRQASRSLFILRGCVWIIILALQ
jgi:hypothetical protein